MADDVFVVEAVRFLAYTTQRLAQAQIPCNAMSAFRHDHLFVPEARAHEALELLIGLAAEAGKA